MDIEFNVNGENIFISMIGELDEATSDFTRKTIDKKLSGNYYQNVVFNMENLKFMDSTGIGVLLGRYKLIKKYGGNVFIAGVNKQIDKVLSMSGIYSIMRKIS